MGLSDSPNDWSLSDTETSDEATSVDSTKVTIDTANHEDGNTQSPDGTEEACCPNTTDAITNQECTVSKSAK